MDKETKAALESCLKYLEMVKRNEDAIVKVFQAQGSNPGFLLVSLDARIAKVKAALTRKDTDA